MITLPLRPRYTMLVSFWVVCSMLLSVFLGVTMAFWFSSPWGMSGVLLAPALLILALVWPQSMAVSYRAWNKAARLFARGARVLIMGLCFAVVSITLGGARAAFGLSRPYPTSSFWSQKRTLTANQYFRPHNTPAPYPERTGWIRHYLAWAYHTGHWWAVCLLPFLLLLRALGEDSYSRSPHNIYTLF